MNIVFGMFFSIFKFIFKWLFILMCPFIIMMFLFYIYYFAKGYRRKKKHLGTYKKRGKLKRLLIDFPRRYILDYFNSDPNYFPEYGVHIFAGEQGSGKTISMIYMIMKYQKLYPDLKVKTNFGYTKENGDITHWKDIVCSENGSYGEIDAIDEMQNWFSSMQSKNFPVEMLEEITQQRKQRKCIFGTSQVWSRVGKPLREQTTYLYEPMTILGCLTIVRQYKPKISADGLTDKKKLRKCFFFVHTKELRESYDTYKKILRLAEDGFVENNPLLENNSSPLAANIKVDVLGARR